MTLLDYMKRAHIRGNRELSRLTRIPHTTMDRIVKDPTKATGKQLKDIAFWCGISCEELGTLVMKGGQIGQSEKERSEYGKSRKVNH